MKPSMQKLRRMRAALSDSLSRDVGQKASAPSLFESLLTGAPIFSNHDLLLVLVFAQAEVLEDGCDAIAIGLAILQMNGNGLSV